MSLRAGFLAFAFCAFSGGSQAGGSVPTLQEEIRALIGLQYRGDLLGNAVAERLRCTDQGGSRLVANGVAQEDWSTGWVKCQGRYVALLNRVVGRDEPHAIFRVVDAVLLPPFAVFPDRNGPNALSLYINGDCEWNGRYDTDFLVLLRWGKRERVDWRTGVKKAWTFDVKKERIVPLSTRHIVCATGRNPHKGTGSRCARRRAS